MAKYHELVKQYSEEIAAIKAKKAEYEALVERVNAINPVLHPEPDFEALAEQEALYNEAREVYHDWVVLVEVLTQDIEAEYHDVPYAKPRQQGIVGFWREAELSK